MYCKRIRSHKQSRPFLQAETTVPISRNARSHYKKLQFPLVGTGVPNDMKL